MIPSTSSSPPAQLTLNGLTRFLATQPSQARVHLSSTPRSDGELLYISIPGNKPPDKGNEMRTCLLAIQQRKDGQRLVEFIRLQCQDVVANEAISGQAGVQKALWHLQAGVLASHENDPELGVGEIRDALLTIATALNDARGTSAPPATGPVHADLKPALDKLLAAAGDASSADAKAAKALVQHLSAALYEPAATLDLSQLSGKVLDEFVRHGGMRAFVRARAGLSPALVRLHTPPLWEVLPRWPRTLPHLAELVVTQWCGNTLDATPLIRLPRLILRSPRNANGFTVKLARATVATVETTSTETAPPITVEQATPQEDIAWWFRDLRGLLDQQLAIIEADRGSPLTSYQGARLEVLRELTRYRWWTCQAQPGEVVAWLRQRTEEERQQWRSTALWVAMEDRMGQISELSKVYSSHDPERFDLDALAGQVMMEDAPTTAH